MRTFLRKAFGNLAVLRHLPGQKRVPYLPEERWRALRDANVRAIVRHAAATVPHYRELFRAERIDPREIRTAGDLERLPLLDKQTVWRAPERFVSEAIGTARAVPLITSGSTGRPLTVYHDRGSLLANIAYGERERDVLATLCGRGVRWKEALLLYQGSTFGRVLDFYRRTTFIPLRPDRLFISIGDPVEQIVDAVNRFRPDVLIGYSGYLEMLYRTLLSRSIHMHRPRLVVFGGEALSAPGRELLEGDFGLRLTALYNAVEAFKIGFACEAGRDYHLHADLCHVTLVNREGRRVPDGTKGEVVISNLVNRATVLLNYRLGDMAAMSARRCDCSRTLPLLGELEGRVEDVLARGDGTFVHPLSIWGIFKYRTDVLRYQLVQHEADRFELRLMTRDEPAYDQLLPGIMQEVQAVLGPAARVEPGYHPKLEAEGPGKFRAVVAARHLRTA